MGAQETTYGYYGKLPFAGDFLRRGLSPAFVSAWDSWLQRALLSSRALLGDEHWTTAYFSAPIWRFAVAPGQCGPRGATGILMPSHDRVGRRFPFCIAAETDLPPLAANLALQPVVEKLETAALEMLEDTARLADLDSRLDALPAPARFNGGAHMGTVQGSLWVAAGMERARVLPLRGMPESSIEAAALFDVDTGLWCVEPRPDIHPISFSEA